MTTFEAQISLSDLNKGLRAPGQSKRDDLYLEHDKIHNNIEMTGFNKLPGDIQEFGNECKQAIVNVEYKMNNPIFEMIPSNEYQQTMASRETRSPSTPSSFSSIM